MESPDSVADVEFSYIRSDLVNNAADIIALVDWLPSWHTWRFPVFGIGTADYDLNNHLIRPRLGLGRIYDLDFRSCKR